MEKPIFNHTKDPTTRAKKRIKQYKIFLFILKLCLFFSIALLDYLAKPLKSDAVIFVPQGSITQIISNLKQQNYNVTNFDTYILRMLGHPQSGWVNMGTKELNKAEFLHKLTIAKAALETLTLIPGETSVVFLSEAATKLNLSKEKLIKEFYKQANPYIEGVFTPQTYKIPKGITEELLVKFLLQYAQSIYAQTSQKFFGEYNPKKWHQYVIKASVIQKEAASIDEMPIVSSVINNRLKNNMKLQMDGTLNYGFYSHEKITPERIRNDNSTYNTYKFEGLPNDAVANVSLEAIKAAIFPAKTNYLYFMRDKATKKHIFTSTLAEHNAVIQRQK